MSGRWAIPGCLEDLLDFLRSVVSELVGSGHVPLGPVDVLVHVPAADHHDVLSLLFVLKGRGGRCRHHANTLSSQA